MKEVVSRKFQDCFHVVPTHITRSPGRINLIGEHTDYNNGYVMPAAIDKSIYAAFSPREDGEIHLYSIDHDDTATAYVEKLERQPSLWPDYVLGVVSELKRAGHAVKGFNIAITGEVPVGAGMSSSAALECAVVFGLNEMFSLGIERVDMVKIAQKAENNFVGMQCGIMDQFASMMGQQDQVILLNCDTLEYKYFPLQLGDYEVLLLDTKVKHSLASSAYNDRRRETALGLSLLKDRFPDAEKLADATPDMLADAIADPVVLKRCVYVTEENRRILDGCDDLAAGRIKDFGRKMIATHDGLSRQYEVSCDELDFLVDQVRDDANVAGARMMGGGFGGCTINLVKSSAVDQLIARLAPIYKQQFSRELVAYRAVLGGGTELIS